jgi:hypothetical protein
MAIREFRIKLAAECCREKESQIHHTTGTYKIEYRKPANEFDRSDSADMFYSFHNLYFEAQFKGLAKCENGKTIWRGTVTYMFHDNYGFQPRDWHPIPGDNETTDRLFWLLQEFGGAAAFKVKGDLVTSQTISVARGANTGVAGGAGGGYGRAGGGSCGRY